jgi:hypothetical protein
MCFTWKFCTLIMRFSQVHLVECDNGRKVGAQFHTTQINMLDVTAGNPKQHMSGLLAYVGEIPTNQIRTPPSYGCPPNRLPTAAPPEAGR